MSDDDTVDNVLAVGEQVEAVGGVLENGLDLISLGDMKQALQEGLRPRLRLQTCKFKLSFSLSSHISLPSKT